MARKVLISFLGAGKIEDAGSSREYRRTLYKFSDVDFEKETAFIASAIAEYEKIETFILLGTMKSMWEAVYEYFAKQKNVFNEEYFWKLVEQTDTSNHQTVPENELFGTIETVLGNNSKVVPLYYGINRKELDYNLEQILSLERHLKNGDELYIDITHSFRSLPVFITTTLFYLNDVSSKRISIKGIYYGMADLYSELYYAPVVKLDSVIETINWIKGAYSFSEYGNAYLIADQLEYLDKSLASKLVSFSDAKNLNLLYELRNQVSSLKTLKFDKLSGLASTIIPQTIKRFLKYFENSHTHSGFQLALAKWYFENKSYSSSIMVLVESIITYVCEQDGNVWNEKQARDSAKKDILSNPIYKNIKGIYSSLNKIRNAVAHSIDITKNTKSSISILKFNILKFQKIIK